MYCIHTHTQTHVQIFTIRTGIIQETNIIVSHEHLMQASHGGERFGIELGEQGAIALVHGGREELGIGEIAPLERLHPLDLVEHLIEHAGLGADAATRIENLEKTGVCAQARPHARGLHFFEHVQAERRAALIQAERADHLQACVERAQCGRVTKLVHFAQPLEHLLHFAVAFRLLVRLNALDHFIYRAYIGH